MPPELVSDKNSASSTYRVSTAFDVWSFGICLYAVLFADLPWLSANAEEDADFYHFCASGISESAPWTLLSEPMCRLIRRTLVVRPERRVTMAEIHSFFLADEPWLADEVF